MGIERFGKLGNRFFMTNRQGALESLLYIKIH